MEKKERHSILLRLIGERGISDQRALQSALQAEGVTVTQATLSRDLKALRVVKHPTNDGYVYVAGGAREDAKADGSNRADVTFSGNLAVVKTRPGYAAARASEIDGKHSRWILGTIAGDDTVLVVLAENAPRDTVKRELQ